MLNNKNICSADLRWLGSGPMVRCCVTNITPLIWRLTLTSPSSDGLSESRGEEISFPCSSLRTAFSFFTRGFLFFTLTFRRRKMNAWGSLIQIKGKPLSVGELHTDRVIPPPLTWTHLRCPALFSAASGDTPLGPVTVWPGAFYWGHPAGSKHKNVIVRLCPLAQIKRLTRVHNKCVSKTLSGLTSWLFIEKIVIHTLKGRCCLYWLECERFFIHIFLFTTLKRWHTFLFLNCTYNKEKWK